MTRNSDITGLVGRAAFLLAALLLSRGAVADSPPTSFTGTWSGSFEIHFEDGRTLKDTAWLVLQQSGDIVTGTAGGKEQEQAPIREGKTSGGEVIFIADSTPGKQLRFVLRPNGDRLAGEAIGEIGDDKVRVAVDVARVGDAAIPVKDALYQEIAALDTRLFEAYNRRDLSTVMSMFTRDLEFYHDRDGLTRYAQNARNFRTTMSETTLHRRELVEGTLRVYPLGTFGALETGMHRFYYTARGEPEKLGATAQFASVWKHEGGTWKISRVLSYEHH
ncbi:MAG: nuclear transport factor 2 family protein [Pseudomonadota bacterium]